MPEESILYSLLVSNVGWIINDCPNYDEVEKLFEEYKDSQQYEQVTMWSSNNSDPIKEFYINLGQGFFEEETKEEDNV